MRMWIWEEETFGGKGEKRRREREKEREKSNPEMACKFFEQKAAIVTANRGERK